MTKTLPVVCFLVMMCPLSQASAHYLWVEIDRQEGEHGSALIHFEEGPAAGDGHYLDHFVGTCKTWFRSMEQIEPQLIEAMDVREGNLRWLAAKLPAGAPRSIECYGKFGVYTYGKTKVLLHYYARNLDVRSHEALHELGRAEDLDLDIVPHDSQGKVELTVLWQGKPMADRLVFIRGPKKLRRNIKTDEDGRVRFAPGAAGTYTLRTSVEEATPGRDDDQEYELVRHNCTMTMALPLER